MSKRVWQYPEVTSIAADDYLLLDNETDGSKSILASKVGAILINKVVTERKVYKASEETGVVNGYKEVSVEVPYTTITDLEGDVVTFEDGEDFPMPSLKVGIEPQQDLHGYDAPWVGGAGKNKLDLVAVFDGKGSYSADGSIYTLDSFDRRPLVQFAETDGNYILTWDNTAYSGTATNVRLEFYNSADKIITSRYCTDATPYAVNGVCKVRVNYSDNGTLSIKNPMIRLATETDSTFEPYSNICPISGWSAVDVTVADDVETPTVSNVYTIDLDGTRYGGKLDVVSGVLTLTHGYIASYNGETLPSTWISDRDVYAEGTTPTIGAEVCYELATPQNIQLTPTAVKSLLGSNNVWGDCGKSLVSYQKTWTPPDFTPEN